MSNGAHIDARTKGEQQTPLHFASKYNAEDVISVLMELGAGLADRDYKERTPMQLAAETGNNFLSCGVGLYWVYIFPYTILTFTDRGKGVVIFNGEYPPGVFS